MNQVVLLLAIGVAGALGAASRYGLVEWTARRWHGRFPVATFAINVTGAFALGVLMTAGVGSVAPLAPLAPLRAVLGTGFLGGYTTFSALSFETHALARRGHTAIAWLNAAGTLCAGVVAVGAGIALGQLISR